MLLVALALCGLSVWRPLCRAEAQPLGEVVVVPFGTPDVSAALQATSMLEAELSNEHVSLIPLHDARDRFTARSRPPQTASDSDLDVLAREASLAIEHVAFGRTAAAQKSVSEVITRAERTLESLNRETGTARHVLDACLSLVRSALQAGKRDVALEQATRCRRLVPDLVPSETAHPANVVGVLAEADNLLRRMHIGNLTVHSAPENNCSVYLNGRHLGTTPFQLDRAAAGDYRVQVECNRTLARVHIVQLGDQAASLLVDTQFDRAVASDPRLLLHYENGTAARDQAISHGAQLGRAVHADDVVLVSVEGDHAELMRVQVGQKRLVALARVPWGAVHGFARPEFDRALVTLSEARLAPVAVELTAAEGTTGPEPATQTGATAKRAPPPSLSARRPAEGRAGSTRDRTWPWTWSLSAAALGTGAAAGGLALLTRREHEQFSSCDPGLPDARCGSASKGQRLQLATNVTLASAGGLAIAAITAFFIERPSARERNERARVVPTRDGLAIYGAF